MLVHSVRFWIKPNIHSSRVTAMKAGLESLHVIPGVHMLLVGTPAPVPPRPAVDASYHFALTIIFHDIDAHNRYQTHPIHQEFVRRFQDMWELVRVFDAA